MAYTPSSVPTCLRMLIDVILYLAGCGGVVVLRLLVDPVTHGFYCHDPGLRFTHHPDSITWIHFVFGGAVAPVVLILLLEIVFRVFLGRRRSFVSCLLATGKLTGLYLYGLLICHLVGEVLKVCAGTPRPHFMDTCKPDLAALNCSQHQFITDYTCTSGVDALDLREAMKSFPSTNAIWVFYAATFLVLYLEERVQVPFSILFKSLTQISLLLLAVFCASTRMADRRHHLSDVLVGSALGIAIGLWTILWVSKHMRGETVFSSVYKVPAVEDAEFIALSDERPQKTFLKPPPSPSKRGPPTSPKLHAAPLLHSPV